MSSSKVLYELEPVRGMEGMKASLKVGNLDINIAVVYGTGNASKDD